MSRRLAIAVALALPVVARAAGGPVFSASASWQQAPPLGAGVAVLQVNVAVQPGWHINSNTPLDAYLIPTTVRLDLPKGWDAAPPRFPRHRLAMFTFSKEPLAVFEGAFVVTIPLHLAEGALRPEALRGVVEAQACNNQLCLAPVVVSFAAPVQGSGSAVPPVTPAAASTLGDQAGAAMSAGAPSQGGLGTGFAGRGLLLQLVIVFFAGLGLNLTPCVYPLIPITVGFFAAQKTAGRGLTWLLAGTYVLGMSLTYSALGVLAALTGRLFGAALQSPWVVGLIVVALLALAASMFGLWELRVPAWATRVSGGRRGLGGALLMGLVVGLVAAPCIGPFVLGLLTYVGQKQDVFLGLMLFVALSLGLGLPYLLLGAFTGALDRLPNSGAWMVSVRQLFGVLLIALAGHFMTPFLTPIQGGALFGGTLILGGLYLLLVARPGHEQPWIDRFMRLASAAILVAGVRTLPIRPHSQGAELTWQPYQEAAVQQALASDQPVVLDFYATWCVPCKELDEKTFSDSQVVARLSGWARFKVDLTTNDPRSEAVRQHFAIAGVPTVVFFRHGREMEGTRVTGFEPPAEFLGRLARVTGQ